MSSLPGEIPPLRLADAVLFDHGHHVVSVTLEGIVVVDHEELKEAFDIWDLLSQFGTPVVVQFGLRLIKEDHVN